MFWNCHQTLVLKLWLKPCSEVFHWRHVLNQLLNPCSEATNKAMFWSHHWRHVLKQALNPCSEAITEAMFRSYHWRDILKLPVNHFFWSYDLFHILKVESYKWSHFLMLSSNHVVKPPPKPFSNATIEDGFWSYCWSHVRKLSLKPCF